MIFKVDDRDISQLIDDLQVLYKRAIPFAIGQTVNKNAFMAQRFAREKIADEFVNRNRFTQQSVQVDRNKEMRNVGAMRAIVGSTQDYMADQEFGAVASNRPSGKGHAIATPYSAGQGSAARRTRPVRRKNRRGSLNLSKRRLNGLSKKVEAMVRIREAVEKGKRDVYLDFGRTKGLFRVVGGRRGTKKGRGLRSARIRMIYNMERQSVTLQKRPWLLPAVNRTKQRTQENFADELERQIRIQRSFKR